MVVVGMHEAKTRLSSLVQRAQDGEEVIIERRGTPVARLVAVRSQRTFVDARDRYPAEELHIAEDFDELPDDIAQAFGMQ
ncbi:MAG: type II toxin-antitoxin system prevent-host-death family antitoxin [Solirubrobacterales bacterium]